jgi:hypothetical protein
MFNSLIKIIVSFPKNRNTKVSVEGENTHSKRVGVQQDSSSLHSLYRHVRPLQTIIFHLILFADYIYVGLICHRSQRELCYQEAAARIHLNIILV